MRKRPALLLFGSLALAGCGNLLQPAAATVNGEKITIHELEKALDEYQATPEFEAASEQGNSDSLLRAFEQEDLTRRIFRAVLEPEAEDRNIEVTEKDVDEELAEVQADFATPAAFEEALKEQGLSLDALRGLIYDRQLEQRLKNEITADLTPSDAELQVFYEDNPQRYIETAASHVVLASRNDALAISKELSKLPEAELEQSFAETARRESIYNATAVAGGDLGYLAPGEADPAFEQAAARASIGGVTEPVQTELGWEVIWIKDRRPIPFEDVREEIIEIVAGEDRDAAWDEWLTEAYDNADIEVNPRYGELDPQTRQVVDPPASDAPGTLDLTPTEAPLQQPTG